MGFKRILFKFTVFLILFFQVSSFSDLYGKNSENNKKFDFIGLFSDIFKVFDFRATSFDIEALNLSEGVDRDGVVHLKWNTQMVDNQKAKAYEILILGRPNPFHNKPISIVRDYFLSPIYVEADHSKDFQETKINVPELLGEKLDGVMKPFLSQADLLMQGAPMILYFAIRATSKENSLRSPIYVPDLGDDNRQNFDENGRALVKNYPNYNFTQSKLSECLPVIISLDEAPRKLKIELLQKYVNEKGGVSYISQNKLSDLSVEIGPAAAKKTLDLTQEEGVSDVFIDRDGIIDIAFCLEDGDVFSKKDIPQYPLYQVQFSKWPKFTMDPTTDYDIEIVNRYFLPNENTYYIYNNFDDYIQPEVRDGEEPTLQSDEYWGSGSGEVSLLKPFLSKNLAIKEYNIGTDGTQDFSSPIYNFDNPYGAFDGVYYIRMRALGLSMKDARSNQDNRYGPWSDIVAVKVEKREPLKSVTFLNTPEETAERISSTTSASFINNGFIPIDFALENGLDPRLQEDCFYEIVISSDAGYISDKVASEVSGKKPKAVAETFFEYVPFSHLGAPGPSTSTHLINMFFHKPSGLLHTDFYIWVRSVSDKSDSIPSDWSNPEHIHLSDLKTIPQPKLHPIDNSDKAIKDGKIPLKWTFDRKPKDPRDPFYKEGNGGIKIDGYQVIVVKAGLSSDSQGNFLVNEKGYLKFEDNNFNGINDWLELDEGDDDQKIYATYYITEDELIPAPVGCEQKLGPIFYINLMETFDITVDHLGDLIKDNEDEIIYQRKVSPIEPGAYDFYVIAKGPFGLESRVSDPQRLKVTKRIGKQKPPRPFISPVNLVDPKISLGKIPLSWSLQSDPSNPRDLVYRDPKSDRYISQYRLLVFRTDLGEDLNIENLAYAFMTISPRDFLKVAGPEAQKLFDELVRKQYLSSYDFKVTPKFLEIRSASDMDISESFLEKKGKIFDILATKSFGLKHEDIDGNGLNDFTSSGEQVYSTYMIGENEILGDLSNLDAPMYYIPLLSIYEVEKDDSEENLLKRDDNGQFIFKRHMRPIKKGKYHLALLSIDDKGKRSLLSPIQSFNIEKDILIPEMPKPNLLRPDSEDQNSEMIKEKGYVTLSWTLGSEHKSPLDDIFIEENSLAYIPFYRVFFYKGLLEVESLYDENGKMTFIDKDLNGENDWLQLEESQGSGRLFNSFWITKERLEEQAKRESHKPENRGKEITDISLPVILPLTDRFEQKNEGANIRYEKFFQDVAQGLYTVLIAPMNRLGMQGPLSDPKMFKIDRTIEEPSNPVDIQLDPISPKIDKNGVIGLNWSLKGVPEKNQDRLDIYPVYEVNIAVGDNSWKEGTYAVDYVESLGKYPLMIPNPDAPREYKKISDWPWIRHLNNPNLPLTYTPNGEFVSKVIPFKDDTTYYFRVRALSNKGFGSKKGEWSNVESVHVDLQNPDSFFPVVVKTVAPERDWSLNDGYTKLLVDDLENNRYFFHYQLPENETLSEKTSHMIEIQESSSELFDNVQEYFYLSTKVYSSLKIGDKKTYTFQRSPFLEIHRNVFGLSVSKPEFGETYYYRARFVGFDLGSPDKVGDVRPGVFGRTVEVRIPSVEDIQKSKLSNSDVKTWRDAG
ncbi:hypothetical protein AB834_02200 [PVC group bacterium (ex Bugula neritina AB1)]|nr:hypothetical protein AB834_02200 [PVC group bacterium (ex Bugula neritina AB1)]